MSPFAAVPRLLEDRCISNGNVVSPPVVQHDRVVLAHLRRLIYGCPDRLSNDRRFSTFEPRSTVIDPRRVTSPETSLLPENRRWDSRAMVKARDVPVIQLRVDRRSR